MSLVLLSHQFVVNGVVLSPLHFLEEMVVYTSSRWLELVPAFQFLELQFQVARVQSKAPASLKTYSARSNSALTTPR